MELDRNYAFKFCSPTRSAIQTGRNPIHVNVQSKCSSLSFQPSVASHRSAARPDMNPINVNPKDPIAGFSAVARNFTGLGTVMKKGGYSTNFAGKWDCGSAPRALPLRSARCSAG